MSTQQEFISELWLERAKNIHHTSDKYNLTALLEGKVKHDAEIDFLHQTQLISDKTTLLDLACGNGRLCEAFANSVQHVTGTDLCEDFIIFLNKWKSENNFSHTDFFRLDLLEADYSSFFSQTYSLIFLFGAAQLIVDDQDLLGILKNVKTLLASNGHFLLKQTTSLTEDDLHIDHYSEELKQRWVANYRTQTKIAQLCTLAGLRVIQSQPMYNENNLGEHYKKIERWDNTKQVIFTIVHSEI
jgi:cyclopropane fatty-acyl-phospholipid synthase-like methyltransferase